jgi:hypothetical protein
MKAMEHGNWFGTGDIKLGFVSGAICGFFKFLDIYLLTDAYSIVLFKVLLTGVVGGFGGVLGKHLFSYLKKIYEQKFKKKKQ